MGDVVVVVAVLVVAVLVLGLLARARDRRPGRSTGAPARGGVGGSGGRTAGQPVGADGGPVPSEGSSAASAGPASEAEPGGTQAGAGTGAGSLIGPPVARAEAPAWTSLPELLRGFELPHGLVPSTGPDQPDPERYLALVTTGAPAEQVGGAVADELERLGYVLHSLSEDEAVARRGGDVLSLRLHPRADEADLAGLRLFPAAVPGAVGVELWSGAGPNPRTR